MLRNIPHRLIERSPSPPERRPNKDLLKMGANHVETTRTSESHHRRNARPACLNAVRRRSKTCEARKRRGKTCRAKRKARDRPRSARLND